MLASGEATTLLLSTDRTSGMKRAEMVDTNCRDEAKHFLHQMHCA